jgi:hypothetical protein
MPKPGRLSHMGTSGNSTQKDKILIKYFHETTWIF